MKRFDWKNKTQLNEIVKKYKTWDDILININENHATTSLKTLKKYVIEHDIDVSHMSTGVKSKDARREVTFSITSSKAKDDKMEIALEWTPGFIAYCKGIGLEGTEEKVIGEYLLLMYKHLLDKLDK